MVSVVVTDVDGAELFVCAVSSGEKLSSDSCGGGASVCAIVPVCEVVVVCSGVVGSLSLEAETVSDCSVCKFGDSSCFLVSLAGEFSKHKTTIAAAATTKAAATNQPPYLHKNKACLTCETEE